MGTIYYNWKIKLTLQNMEIEVALHLNGTSYVALGWRPRGMYVCMYVCMYVVCMYICWMLLSNQIFELE